MSTCNCSRPDGNCEKCKEGNKTFQPSSEWVWPLMAEIRKVVEGYQTNHNLTEQLVWSPILPQTASLNVNGPVPLTGAELEYGKRIADRLNNKEI